MATQVIAHSLRKVSLCLVHWQNWASTESMTAPSWVEVAVVQAETPCELPDSFDGIEVRGVGRQIVQREVRRVLFSP
jgi:hypothetical protein